VFDEDSFIVKFNTSGDETPPAFAPVTHPVNRFDLPFTTLTGLVDTDLYRMISSTFRRSGEIPGFQGVLPKGTPVAQCLPVKRDLWTGRFATIAGDAIEHLQETTAAKPNDPGIDGGQFRRRNAEADRFRDTAGLPAIAPAVRARPTIGTRPETASDPGLTAGRATLSRNPANAKPTGVTVETILVFEIRLLTAIRHGKSRAKRIAADT